MAIKFLFKEAIRSLLRLKKLNLIALGAMSMSLMALGLVLLLNIGIFKLTNFVEKKVEVVAFLKDKFDENKLKSFLGSLRKHPLVEKVEYISKQQAYRDFSKDKSVKHFLDVLGSNPLPASIKIRLLNNTPRNVKFFVSWLNNFYGIAEVNYGGGEADRLLKVLQFIRLAIIILTVSLILAAIIIIANIISLMVFARQSEIELMRIIGATNNFIRGPFLIWGMLQGALSGLLASSFIYAIWKLLSYYALKEVAIDMQTILPNNIVSLVATGTGILIAVGLGLGLVGSLVSVGRQLKL